MDYDLHMSKQENIFCVVDVGIELTIHVTFTEHLWEKSGKRVKKLSMVGHYLLLDDVMVNKHSTPFQQSNP